MRNEERLAGRLEGRQEWPVGRARRERLVMVCLCLCLCNSDFLFKPVLS